VVVKHEVNCTFVQSQTARWQLPYNVVVGILASSSFSVDVDRGVVQGDIFSPLCFIIAFQQIRVIGCEAIRILTAN